MRAAGVALWIAWPALAAAQTTVEFNRDVRPILSDKCFLCHGPDAAAKRVPRRLDSEAAAKADRAGIRAVVDGRPDQSELIRRITSADAAYRMPPASSGFQLTAAEIQTLRHWIAQGARWQPHWAFLPPKRPALPKVKNTSWPRNPIDALVLNRLEREGLRPSPGAGRETLLRRVSLDLTGLPPTPAEIDAFLEDRSPHAYEKVVDRLLASPRYGERMAARWLDAARYADTNGYQYDGERVMWRWRDWVIEAFNRNQPFDRFTLDQIAGDLLPRATLEQKMATGFSRNHRGNTEDGIVPEEYRVEYAVDRLETAFTVFQGLTLGCARCHNHKYDPFSQKEFYQVYAYFNNVPELGRAMKYGNSPPLVAAPTREQQRQLDQLNGRIRILDEQVDETVPAGFAPPPGSFWAPASELDRAFLFESPGEAKARGGEPSYVAGRAGQAASLDGKTYLEADGAAAFDIDERFTLAAWVNPEAALDGAVLTRMTEGPRGKGFGVYLNRGKVHVHITSSYDDDAIRLDTEETLEAGRWRHLGVTYTGSRLADGIQVYLDGRAVKVKVEIDTLYRPFRNAGRVFREPFRIGGGAGPQRRFRGLVDEVRIWARVLADDEMAALAAPLETLAGKPERRRILRWYYLDHAAPDSTREAWRSLTALHREREKLERSFPTVMVMTDMEPPRPTHVLQRGLYNKPGEKVEPGVPAALGSLPPGAPNNRLGLAQWLIHSANPLLGRVTVNRFWQMYFGAGLVRTVEDFGLQGDWPSHPELLDWLATEFVRSGWDVKGLQKLIVTSATYRQSSRATPELLQRDPENRLLARGPRFRLPAEMVRDQALLAAGLLKEKLGGPSVKPYQPEGLWKDLIMQDMYYVQSKGDDLYRRGLYTFWKRTVAPPMMANFDAANREVCVVRQSRTNTPLQALNLMNDLTFVEAARFVGQRMIREGGPDPASRLRHGFRLVAGRAPAPRELDYLHGNLQYHLGYFTAGDRAKAYLRHGDSPADPGLEPRELAAYAAVASLLLNLDETVSKE